MPCTPQIRHSYYSSFSSPLLDRPDADRRRPRLHRLLGATANLQLVTGWSIEILGKVLIPCKSSQKASQYFRFTLQGDHSGCVKPPVDIKTNVAFQYMGIIQKQNYCFNVNGSFATT